MSHPNKNERMQTMSCGALAWRVVDADLQVLLIKQFAHKESWGVPKGHIDEGESITECAKREVMEETGIKVVLDDRLPDVFVSSKHEDKTVITFLARPEELRAEPAHDDPDNEVADARWFNVSELPRLLSYQQPMIEAAVASLRAAQQAP